VSYFVDASGALGIVRADRETDGPSAVTVSRFDGTVESAATPLAPAPRDHHVAALVDGGWIVTTRGDWPEANADRYDADGRLIDSFALGDAIERVCAAPDGSLWVGYFDEGISAPQNRDGAWPPSCSGLAQFGIDGSQRWKYLDAIRRDGVFAYPIIDDCYALTLDGSDVWFCAYRAFSITRVRNGVVRSWTNGIRSAKALAVDDDYVILAGGSEILGSGYTTSVGCYDPLAAIGSLRRTPARIALVRLDEEEARLVGTVVLPALYGPRPRLCHGQGATLHVVTGDHWTRLTVAAVRALLQV
jgi:hypothetical protein